MKIGLIDVDNQQKKARFPNIALMKLSAHHKSIGDQVEWYDNYSGKYDTVYMSKVFDFSEEPEYIINADQIIKGGVAYDLDNKLPHEIEHQYPDYSIYGIENTAYGFLSRGCPRNCHFCNVTQHQGSQAIKAADLSEFWNGQKEIKLLDPNTFACKDWKDISQQLIDSKAYIDFTQGVDIRLMTGEKIAMLNQMKIKMIHFAWDNYEFKTYDKLKRHRNDFRFAGRNMRVYVLTNFNTTQEQDLERVYKLRELDYDPYVMIFDKWNAPRETRQLQRWVNNKFIWRTCERFEDYGKPKKEKEMNGQTTIF